MVNVELDISYVNEHLFMCTYIAFCHAGEGRRYGKDRGTLRATIESCYYFKYRLSIHPTARLVCACFIVDALCAFLVPIVCV